jgi:hypothetical protein
VKARQSAHGDAVGDRIAVETRSAELRGGDGEMLPASDRGEYFFGHVRL